ncbi:MAG: dihydroorotate dehydrogenase 2, nonfunctional [Parcubacteria group bacterium GW2011_GWB1_56_8]|nr:MAG: dihydroorotate dehydrogenase 2, nonfunctional [Parcubacteria group bacterium GW2011_GWB1_56_8]
MARRALYKFLGFCYRVFIRKILFLQDSEAAHVRATHAGERIGRSPFARNSLAFLFRRHSPELAQTLFGLRFASPLGLAAGFDYEARLTQIMPALGFGFGTVGTLTSRPYRGNPRPMLGRLSRSRSLLVNKGFKNLGVAETLSPLRNASFAYPVGVSIGKTNAQDILTQKSAMQDIVMGFKAAEKSGVPFAYYELNISCPNLMGSVEFYEPAHLEELLSAVGALGLKRPVWVKMPISKTDRETEAMLRVVIRHSFVKAVVFGNLQSFSGLPCRNRSDELIRLAYSRYESRLTIVGCGGVFSTDDAYRKITLGASLVELITGLVYEGPQLAALMNEELHLRLRRDGHASLSAARGSAI